MKVLRNLSDLRIYFGHQSVGADIVQGIREFDPGSIPGDWVVAEMKDANSQTATGIVHERIGKNGDPVSKINAFCGAMGEGRGKTYNVALMKLCYVDITADTEIPSLFALYAKRMRDLNKQLPDLKIVHCTVPLRAMGSVFSDPLAVFGGKRRSERLSNVKRHEYNQMVHREFARNDAVFDIATAESTVGEGRIAGFEYQGQTYPSLAREYTYDGGHLNAVGRRVVGMTLLKVLKGISER